VRFVGVVEAGITASEGGEEVETPALFSAIAVKV